MLSVSAGNKQTASAHLYTINIRGIIHRPVFYLKLDSVPYRDPITSRYERRYTYEYASAYTEYRPT
jgi:hypothetical protein